MCRWPPDTYLLPGLTTGIQPTLNIRISVNPLPLTILPISSFQVHPASVLLIDIQIVDAPLVNRQIVVGNNAVALVLGGVVSNGLKVVAVLAVRFVAVIFAFAFVVITVGVGVGVGVVLGLPVLKFEPGKRARLLHLAIDQMQVEHTL